MACKAAASSKCPWTYGASWTSSPKALHRSVHATEPSPELRPPCFPSAGTAMNMPQHLAVPLGIQTPWPAQTSPRTHRDRTWSSSQELVGAFRLSSLQSILVTLIVAHVAESSFADLMSRNAATIKHAVLAEESRELSEASVDVMFGGGTTSVALLSVFLLGLHTMTESRLQVVAAHLPMLRLCRRVP